MAESAFSLVKKAIVGQGDVILREYGVKHKKGDVKLGAEWTTGFLCPLCGDASGSASFTPSLYLKCHQCSTKADVFDWLARFASKKPWDLCKELADRLNVTLPKFTRAKGLRGMPTRMTEELLVQAVSDLWTHDDAAPARAILEDRKLADQVLLSELEVGWMRGWIVFSNRDEKGNLHERYRGWNPANPKLRWMWFGVGTGGPSIWPSWKPKEGDKILLLEGESDVMTAIVRLKLHELGWHVCTWTAGATSCPKPSDVPHALHGRELHIGYDNDVFQGSDYLRYVVTTKPGKDPNHARMAMEQRLHMLLERVAPLFVNLECNVIIRQCPVDPNKNFGGDFRDWVDEGGRDLTDWLAFPFDSLPAISSMMVEVPFEEVFAQPHRSMRVKVQVEAIARDDVLITRTFDMRCDMGQHNCCASCPGARLFPDRIITMTDYQRELAVGLAEGNVVEKIIKDVIQRPRQCPRCEVVPIEVVVGSDWRGMKPGHLGDTQNRSLRIISEEPPSLSGEVELEGVAYPNGSGDGVVMLAKRATSLDQTDVDLAPFFHDFLTNLPVHATRVEEIDDYLDRRWRDLSFNVTRIHGRRDIQVAHDLLMHSVTRAVMDGVLQRGWLDICIFGDTRTGKTETMKKMFGHHGLGVHYAAINNMSRAGLVMGADRNGFMKPGLYPRCHGKALMLDEVHLLVKGGFQDDHPMSWLQSARDSGVVSGIKIYGSRDLPAAVRFCTIANWTGNKKNVFKYTCEHLTPLYGAPEVISRLDFPLAVEGHPEKVTLDESEHFWTKDRTRALILRAWAQTPEQVIIEPEAFALAREKCRSWSDFYYFEVLPLFTPEEKPFSLMRIAIAIANLCFSHPRGSPLSVHVRPVHVEWAAKWLQRMWIVCGYQEYSMHRQEMQRLTDPISAERLILQRIASPDEATSMLDSFLTPFTSAELPAILSEEPIVATKWLGRMMNLRVFERVRDKNVSGMLYHTTRGGNELIRKMMEFANGDSTAWMRRKEQLATFTSTKDMKPITERWGDD